MRLTGLSVENFKPFSKRIDIELGPLTVLIGRNSSGKSALARLPLLIGRALSSEAVSPVELDASGVDFGASFVDLIHNRVPHGSIGLGATFDNGTRRISFHSTVQHVDEFMLQVVSRFVWSSSDRAPVTMTWLGREPLADPGDYVIEHAAGVSTEVKASFKGLLPTIASDSTGWKDELQKLKTEMTRVFERMGYQGPFREGPQRQYRFPGGLPQSVGVSGREAPALLGADYLRQKGVVLKEVGSWFEKHLGGWPLTITRSGDSFSLVLVSPDKSTVEVNLSDAGTGLSQVLPLVVQRLFDATTGKAGGIEIVEQPELHLHPAAHGPLADLYIAASAHSDACFIVETHSENFLLRLRRRIAEGLDPKRVKLYWINDSVRPGSQVEEIQIHENGDVSNWPPSVFSEDFEEVRAIRNAQRARTKGPQA
jgi:hypothetical protein